MRRAGWLVVLVVCLAAAVSAGVAIYSTNEPENVGGIEMSEHDSTQQEPAPPDTVAMESTNERAGASPTVPDVGRSSAQFAERDPDAAQPARLRVADVGLDGPVDATGVRDDGLMEIPDDGDRAGWYRYGPAPGSGQGSVVIAGHVDTQEGLGVMAALRKVSVGTVVQVELSDGDVREYEIIGRETIPKDDLPMGDIFGRGGPERLTLITCGGPWRSSESSYRDNVVVVATPLDGR